MREMILEESPKALDLSVNSLIKSTQILATQYC